MTHQEFNRFVASFAEKRQYLDRARLEEAVHASPGDIESRVHLALLLAAESELDALMPHAAWLVENAPTCVPENVEPPHPGYSHLRLLWLAMVRGRAADQEILLRAIRFLKPHDLPDAVGIVEAALHRFPDSWIWEKRAGELVLFGASRGLDGFTFERAQRHFERFLLLFEGEYQERRRVLELRGRAPEQRPCHASRPALAAFGAGNLDRAFELASVAVAAGPIYNGGDERHIGHTVLGRIALRRGDVAAAKMHLRSSIAQVGPTDLRHAGPSLELAQDLLDLGHPEGVSTYLRDVSRMWDRGDTCVAWADAIDSGERPRMRNPPR